MDANKKKKITDLDATEKISSSAVIYVIENGKDRQINFGQLLKNIAVLLSVDDDGNGTLSLAVGEVEA